MRAAVAGLRADQERRTTAERLAFVGLAGFVASQGFTIPLFSVGVNWALWPTLPDVFGLLLILSVFFSAGPALSSFNAGILKYVLVLLVFLSANFLFVTVPNSVTGEGLKYGAFSLFLLAKFAAVFWAASKVPITAGRLRVLHVSAWFAFSWLVGTFLASFAGWLDMASFISHLPSDEAGRWSVRPMSTVASNHGGTTVVLLVVCGLIAATARRRLSVFLSVLMVVSGAAVVFLSGSRQGLVRFVVFAAALYLRSFLVVFSLFSLGLVGMFLASETGWLGEILDTSSGQRALARQSTFLDDPFTNEGLNGRPEIWRSVFQTLDARPVRYLVGTGIGNYAEFRNAAHNMILQMIQDGGVIALIVMGACYFGIFRSLWRRRREMVPVVAMTAGMLTSFLTSSIFYPNLATGWYLGAYLVCLHLAHGRAELLPETPAESFSRDESAEVQNEKLIYANLAGRKASLSPPGSPAHTLRRSSF